MQARTCALQPCSEPYLAPRRVPTQTFGAWRSIIFTVSQYLIIDGVDLQMAPACRQAAVRENCK